MKKINFKKGTSLIEIIIGLAIISTSFFSVISAYHFFIKVAVRNASETKVSYLLEEGVEVTRFLRDSDWTSFSTLATSTDYHLVFDGGTWKATTTNIYIDNRFERKFVLGDVYRNIDGDISDVGTLDAGARKIDVFVSFPSGNSTTTRSVNLYLTNLFQ
ncbi:hypothetical protein A3I18_01775 [Candidatus Campbellbacteria bacterium RIFCSPLOWO2_02_FULL_35_11]|uniref:Prepilin-type N-terminal cleavage/methylation domain-containing protein n=2 Tax=Candidatus Campbelliibacteriota TaxID=1752727 RepID=A0A1F5EQI4_9BACT|nr:MAG: hypothetical protein A3E89_02000 [Candidatus Campbellbacteria bacterium RIFCSPHIGHO2_12_FULL_35_10]OGD69937.1 MAG: hypothetical protein A3I18_01775 [Candidatus Campbellbacteria bacterium RIFCSPLOWO2_02_FULL_35_11]